MTELIALSLFVILSGVAALHLYWAFGGVWPAQGQASLARTVVGVKGLRKMPGTSLTVLVSVLIAVAGLLPLVLTGLLPNPLLTMITAVPEQVVTAVLLAGLAFVFLGRGLLSYTSYFEKMEAEEPFVTLDRRYYAPLCLVLGAGFLLLAIFG